MRSSICIWCCLAYVACVCNGRRLQTSSRLSRKIPTVLKKVATAADHSDERGKRSKAHACLYGQSQLDSAECAQNAWSRLTMLLLAVNSAVAFLPSSQGASFPSRGCCVRFLSGSVPRFHGVPCMVILDITSLNSSVVAQEAVLGDMPNPLQEILEQSSAALETQAVASMASSERVQRIKNICVDKEILNVLTSCEFAMRLEVAESSAEVDFTSLLARIDRSLDILRLRYNGKTGEEDTLVQRLLETKEELEAYVGAYLGALADPGRGLGDGLPASNMEDAATETGASVIQEVRENIPSLNFVVREDGSVDWDEALASSREVARFGVELWERLNGKEKEEGLPSFEELFGQAQVKTEMRTPEMERLQVVANKSVQALKLMLETEANTKQQLRLAKADGQSISSKDLTQLRNIADKVEELRKVVTLSELNLDMERICAYLEQDLEESGLDVTDLKLLVAEVNFIERQLTSLMGGIGTQEMEATMTGEEPNLLVTLVDDEELALVQSKVVDLKSRLGIEGSLAAPIDWGTIGEVLKSTGVKIQDGLSFFGEGTQMLGLDVLYACRLFVKALTGYTLKPREVNVLRRAFRDLLTLVPFTIILIIPLSPPGHVLVFSFIQKYFPDFFPSCYSEKRLNLRRLYSEVSKSEADLLGEPPKTPFR